MDLPSSLSLMAGLKHLAVIRRFIEQRAEALGACPEDIDELILAVDEAATNIVVHGYRGGPGKIEIEMQREGPVLVVRLIDETPPFDPTLVPSPDLSVPLDQRPFGGMGVYLMRESVDEIHHRIRPQGGNELSLVKNICSESIKTEG